MIADRAHRERVSMTQVRSPDGSPAPRISVDAVACPPTT
jgi:hypothetical protein